MIIFVNDFNRLKQILSLKTGCCLHLFASWGSIIYNDLACTIIGCWDTLRQTGIQTIFYWAILKIRYFPGQFGILRYSEISNPDWLETKKFGIIVIDYLILVEKMYIYNNYFNIIFYIFCLNIWFLIFFILNFDGLYLEIGMSKFKMDCFLHLCIMRINNLYWSSFYDDLLLRYTNKQTIFYWAILIY